MEQDISQMNLHDTLQLLRHRIQTMEQRFSELGYVNRTLVQTEVKTKYTQPAQVAAYYGMHTAFCVETIDPLKQGRVRYFSPLMHDPEVTIKQLDWAYPISAMGGFDDCGLTWVPPAGSKLCMIFEGGNRFAPYYFGTTWDRDRGPDGQHLWNYNIEEYYKIHEGHRKGYMIGPNDGSQVFAPWNTENYNGLDIDSMKDFEEDTEAQKKITYPNIYGFKTPQKHMLKMVDGNYKCNFRWTRIELKSGAGGLLVFKDDHLHPSGQWLHPDCQCGGGDVSECNDEEGNPLEKAECPPDGDQSQCANPYHKHESECKPYKGVGTPQNNKIDLEQSGIQIISPSGHTLRMDDSVEEPQGVPRWERGTEPFDFGCTDLFEGATEWISATGHKIRMDDIESDTEIRDEENRIEILTATGNKIELNDHTIGCGDSPPQAGERRGIHMQTTSNHTFDMADVDNLQCQPRKEGGVPDPSAKNAYVQLRTGYGLMMRMEDFHTQEQETQRQAIMLFAPQYTACCGPHIIRMQEDPSCGQIFVRAGGDYVCSTEGDHYTVVGHGDQSGSEEFSRPSLGDDEMAEFCKGGCLGPKNKIIVVSKNTLHKSCKDYFNIAEHHIFLADRKIFLLAGKDCPTEDGGEKGPCIWPVVVLQGNRLVASDRVYASASCSAPCINIWHILAGTICPPLDCD
jgi:hypothetical protein